MFPAVNKGVWNAGIEERSEREKDVVIDRVNRGMAKMETHRGFLAKLRERNTCRGAGRRTGEDANGSFGFAHDAGARKNG